MATIVAVPPLNQVITTFYRAIQIIQAPDVFDSPIGHHQVHTGLNTCKGTHYKL